MTSSVGGQTDTAGSKRMLWAFIAISVVLLVGFIAYAVRSKRKKSQWFGRYTFKERSALEGLYKSSDDRCVPWYVYPLTLLGVGVPVFLYYKDTIRAYFNPDSEETNDTEGLLTYSGLSTYATPKNIAIGGGVVGLGVVGIAALRKYKANTPIGGLEREIKDQEGQQNKKANGSGQRALQRPQKKPASTETGWFDGATPGSWRFLWWLTDRLGRLFCNFCGNPTTLAKESTGQESEGYGGKLEYRIPGCTPFLAYAFYLWFYNHWVLYLSLAILTVMSACSCKQFSCMRGRFHEFSNCLCGCKRFCEEF